MTAEAHEVLFNRVFEIVEQDVGKKIEIAYMHDGRGYEAFTFDEHKGQAKGTSIFQIVRRAPY